MLNVNNVNDIFVDKLLGDIKILYPNEKYFELAIIFCSLKGLSAIHQSHHWKAQGPMFNSDHELFNLLYTNTHNQIDGVVERTLGLSGIDTFADAEKLTAGSYKFMKLAKEGSNTDVPCNVSLHAEEFFIDILEACMDNLQNNGLLSRGLEQLLGDIANIHENHVYLLSQRCK